MSTEHDLEKKVSLSSEGPSVVRATTTDNEPSWLRGVTSKLTSFGVETHGVSPVQVDDQTYTSFKDLFFLWLSANAGIITFSSGTLGPIAFGLGLRDSALVILFVNMFGALLPAYFSTFGPITGLRQMIHARFAFGYIGAALLSCANVVTFMGFLILNVILGGQALASASSGNLSWNVGIVIISLMALFITFCGYRVLSIFEKYAWIPVVTVFIIVAGVAGKHLENPPPLAPATCAQVLSFAATIAGFIISWCTLAADYTIYMPPTVSRVKVFVYAYLGFFLPLCLLEIMGAAFINTAFVNEAWMDGYDANGASGLLAASLEPVGKFGKFCMVVLAIMSVPAACAPTMYSFGISFQCISPIFSYVPRWIFSICATAILIPVAITASPHFTTALTNFLAVIGYYAASFAAITLIEHKFFRKASADYYDRNAWNSWSRLPIGWAGCLAFAMSFAFIIPGMDEIWYTGPIAKKGSGDIGFEVGFVSAGLFYFVLRTIDLKFVTKKLGGSDES